LNDTKQKLLEQQKQRIEYRKKKNLLNMAPILPTLLEEKEEGPSRLGVRKTSTISVRKPKP